jgi:hypothetical protein
LHKKKTPESKPDQGRPTGRHLGPAFLLGDGRGSDRIGFFNPSHRYDKAVMTKKRRIETIQKILRLDAGLHFALQLKAGPGNPANIIPLTSAGPYQGALAHII